MANSTARAIAILIVLVLLVGFGSWAYINNKKIETAATPVLSISALNQTQNVDATSGTARPGDIIVFTLTAENHSSGTISGFVVDVQISDLTEKSTLVDASGASYNSATDSVSWTPLDIPANGNIQKQFSVRVNQDQANLVNPVMRITYNNQLAISIVTSTVAGTATGENPSNNYTAPASGPGLNIVFWLAISATAGFLLIKKSKAALN